MIMITKSAKIQHHQLTPLLLNTYINMWVPPVIISLVIRTSFSTSDYVLISILNFILYININITDIK